MRTEAKGRLGPDKGCTMHNLGSRALRVREPEAAPRRRHFMMNLPYRPEGKPSEASSKELV